MRVMLTFSYGWLHVTDVTGVTVTYCELRYVSFRHYIFYAFVFMLRVDRYV